MLLIIFFMIGVVFFGKVSFVIPGLWLRIACAFSLYGFNACRAYPSHIRKVCLFFIVFLFGFFVASSALSVWKSEKKTFLSGGRSTVLCGHVIKPIKMKLPSQRWLFRLKSYRWYSLSSRYDQVVLHAYQAVPLEESAFYCLQVHQSKKRVSFPSSVEPFKQIAHHVLGDVQLEKILSVSMKESWVSKARKWVKGWVSQFSLPSVRHALLALLLGDRSKMNRDDWDLFSKTGTSHLVAVSGLHVMWVILSVVRFLSKCIGCIPCLYRFVPKSRVESIVAISIVFLYGSLLYPSASADRALLLLSLHAIFRFFGDTVSSKCLLFSLFGVTLLFDPFSYLNVSVCLSYWAAFWLLSYPSLGAQETVKHWLLSQLWMILGLLPLTLFYFGYWYGVSFFANIIAVPWMGLLLFPSCLFGLSVYSVSHHVFSLVSHWVQAPIGGLLFVLHTMGHHSIVSLKTTAFGVFSLLVALCILWGFSYAPSRNHYLLLLLPFCVFLLVSPLLHLSQPRKAIVPYGRARLRVESRKGRSYLLAEGLSKRAYQYALSRYALTQHWGRFDYCFSDKGLTFPAGLCKLELPG